MQVLIVEDDKPTLFMLKYYIDILQVGGCEDAGTVNEGLAKVTSKRYDLIMLDLLLDGEFSTPIIEQILKSYPIDTPRICVMSALTNGQKFVEQYKIHKYAEKPYLLEFVDELVAENNV